MSFFHRDEYSEQICHCGRKFYLFMSLSPDKSGYLNLKVFCQKQRPKSKSRGGVCLVDNLTIFFHGD
jgi:hypothetical protein